MRYIGNKTRLLDFIRRSAESVGLVGGSMHDAFSGTASVGRAFKEAGWRVASSDIMTYSYVFQRAYVVTQRSPSFAALRSGVADVRAALRSASFRDALAKRHARLADTNGACIPAPTRALAAVAAYLSSWLDPEPGFMTRHYSPRGGRMYFTEENAGRIDAIRRCLHEWRAAGLIGDDEFFILLAALIEAADRVANTAGVYAAYIKSWQPNALRPLTLAPLSPIRGPRGAQAHQADAVTVAARLGPVDLIYVDPPYNSRQYAGYYHVPEIIARGWFDDEPAIAGKTGLLAAREQRSDWCSARKVEAALTDLLEATHASHILLSYNTEGLLPEESMLSILARFSADGHVRRFTHRYRRYRADGDASGRSFRAGELREILYYARLRWGGEGRRGSREQEAESRNCEGSGGRAGSTKGSGGRVQGSGTAHPAGHPRASGDPCDTAKHGSPLSRG
jgi:adenine-specific DNA-methyltransferase